MYNVARKPSAVSPAGYNENSDKEMNEPLSCTGTAGVEGSPASPEVVVMIVYFMVACVSLGVLLVGRL